MRSFERVRYLLKSSGRWWYALDLSNVTRTRAGRLYVVLSRLEREGVVESQWAPVTRQSAGGRRRMYRWIAE